MRRRICESWYANISSVARHKASLSYAPKFIDTPDGISSGKIQAISDTLTVAGSDTTATLLTAATFFLLKIFYARHSHQRDPNILCRGPRDYHGQCYWSQISWAVIEEALR